MSNDVEQQSLVHPPPFAVVQPLGYAPPAAEGWETPIRLTLWASGIYHAITSASTIAQAGWYFGQYTRTGSLAANPGAAVYVLLELLFTAGTAVAAIASFLALRHRASPVRLTIIWGAGIAAGGRLALALVQFATMFLMRGAPNSSIRANFGAVGYAGYMLMSAIGPFASLIFPALIIALLTRPGARRAFGEPS